MLLRSHQLSISPLLNNLPLIKQINLIRIHYRLNSMRNNQRTLSRHLPIDVPLHFPLSLPIQGRRRLIQHQDLGLANERTSNSHSLLLPP